ncbi:MAG: MBL fold metallo-hydrolase [Anaerolineaceae bacterium]|jgi:glyoxylase-like metal-dependent hydrolase (beta-lactamase superfamily II)
MHRERVSDNVYWFQSEVYAQVTAGAVTGPNWAVMIDTLALPEETLEMRDYIETVVGVPVRYVINTHYHADHSWGNCFFPGAAVIAHSLAREAMFEKGEASLDTVKKQNATFKQVKLVPPNLTFSSGSLTLRVGKKTLVMSPAPGHSADGISVLVEEDRVLFAGDAFMPLPYMVDGNPDMIAATIKQMGKLGLENIIQGHGDIILRGEIEEATRSNLAYINALRKGVRAAARRRNPLEALAEIDIESCGKSRVTLGGLGIELHKRNLVYLYKTLSEEDSTAE